MPQPSGCGGDEFNRPRLSQGTPFVRASLSTTGGTPRGDALDGFSMRLTHRRFGRLVAEAVAALPEEVQAAMENVSIMVQEWPSEEQLASGEPDNRYSLLGLYEGIPRTDRSSYNLVLPDRITLFQRPLEAACGSREELEQEVRVTIVHEIAHHLGWSDEELERLGYP